MIAPRWEHQTHHLPLALALRPDGGVAALFDDGSKEFDALEIFDSAGARSGGLRLPKGAPADRGDGMARTSAAILRFAGNACFASIPHEAHLVRHTGDRSSRFAQGDSAIEAFAIAGEQVAVARIEGLELWNLSEQRRWHLPGGPYSAVAFAGRTLVALRADGEIVFVSSVKGSVIGSLKLAAPSPPSAWHLSTIDGTRVALGFDDWLVVVDGTNHKIVRRTRVRSKVLALASSEKRIAVGFEDGFVQLLDAFTGEPKGVLHAHREPVVGLAMGTGVVFSAGAPGHLRAWEESAFAAPSREASPVTALASRATFMAVGDGAGRLRVVEGGEEVGALRLDGAIRAVHVTADDAVTAATGSVLVQLKRPWKSPHPVLLRAPSTALAVDSAYAFSGSETGTVDVYEVPSGDHVTSYALSEAPITGLVRLPGVLLVVGTSALDGRVFIVDVAQAKVLHRIEAHQEAFGVTALATEPRGRLVASGSDDGRIALIDPAKGRVLAHVGVPETPICLAFDSTGRKLAAVLADGSSVIVTIDRKPTIKPLAYRTATRVAWGDTLFIGLSNGPVERVATA